VNQQNLKEYNTMQLAHSCPQLYVATDQSTLISALSADPNSWVIGGGSNILITQDLDRPVIIIDTKGIAIVGNDDSSVMLKVAAGENWHQLVMWSISQGYGGIENLSLIPGKCGAAPMQNIGAYGVELSDVLVEVHTVDKQTQKKHVLSVEECQLGYRDSIFKRELKDQVIITDLVLRLSKQGHHKFMLSYGSIRDELEQAGVQDVTIADVSAAVIKIRQSKLPDPAVLPNVGSFFKNPIITQDLYNSLAQRHPDMPHYPLTDEAHVKIPAGWLIDRSGLKGYRVGDVGTHVAQALVIVNHGAQRGQDILDFSATIQAKVFDRYGINLEREVNIFQ
jgi:UDP-N-acetylmuramate dehydrogenase